MLTHLYFLDALGELESAGSLRHGIGVGVDRTDDGDAGVA